VASDSRPAALAGWTEQAIADGRRWVAAWKVAGPRLEEVRRRELRETDAHDAIARLCGSADYEIARRSRPRGWSSSSGCSAEPGRDERGHRRGPSVEAEVVERASAFDFPPRVALRTCSAEDLIVLKAFASRPKDWMDVDGVIVRQAGRLDWSYVERQLAPLAALKEEPELMDALTRRRLALDR
jgi:hypothetical protein